MPHCPVCQVRYVSSRTPCCLVCGWDVQPLSLLLGLIPEVVEKEAIRLQWAQKLWHSVQVQREKLGHLQSQAHEITKPESPNQNPPTLAHQEQNGLAATLPQSDFSTSPIDSTIDSGDLNPEPAQALGGELATRSASQDKAMTPADQAVKVAGSEAPEAAALLLDRPTPTLQQSQRQSQQPIPAQRAAAQTHAANPALLESLQRRDFIFPTQSMQPDRTAAQATAIVAPPPHPIDLQAFDFDVVTITLQGSERCKQTAFCFHQSLEAGVDLEMVLVPGGQFWMGSPDSEVNRDSHESPRHQVTLAPFCLSKFPITQRQWRAIATLPKIQRSLSLCPANFEGDNRPVEQVTWYDAIEFCARLSQSTGQHYRLPSEAEWEYACRAGTSTPFHYGNTLLPDLANYDGNYLYGAGRSGCYRQETTPVGAFQNANAFGLFDMHGNVWEWCADPWHENYQSAPSDSGIWISDEGGNYQVLRGGAWYCLPSLCRSAQRHWNQPDVGGSGIGFRVTCLIA